MQRDAPEDNDEYAFINLETQSESQTPRHLEPKQEPKINNFSLNNHQEQHHKDQSCREIDQLPTGPIREHRTFIESLKQTVKANLIEPFSRRSSRASSGKLQYTSRRGSADYELTPTCKVVPYDREQEDERGEDEILATVTTERAHILRRETEEIPVEEEKSYKNLDDLRISNAKFDSPLRMDLDLVQETVSEFSTPNDQTSTRFAYPMTPSTASRYS